MEEIGPLRNYKVERVISSLIIINTKQNSMNLNQVKKQLEQLHQLIEHRVTGTPCELAKRLGVTDRTLRNYLSQMNSLGAHIEYSRLGQTYYYKFPVNLKFGFEPLKENTTDEGEIGGGKYLIINVITGLLCCLPRTKHKILNYFSLLRYALVLCISAYLHYYN